MRKHLLTLGATPLPGTPDDLRRQLAREAPAWRKVIQDAGLKAECAGQTRLNEDANP